MEEKKKHKVMIGIEVVLLCMIIAIIGTNAASSNPPSNGVSYNKNSQTTVEGALNDLYTKANFGNASAAQILSGKTALVGGKKITGTMPSKNGSSKATKVSGNASNLYMVFPYGYYPAETHFSTGNSSEVYASNADVASAIGLTKEKLIKGQSVLGITGTGETGYSSCSSCCPTLASQTSSATAGAGDILSGKTAYVNGSKITGTMTNRGAVTGTVSPGGSYTIEAGYHNGSGKVTASSCSACPTCNPGLSVSSTTTSLSYTKNMTLNTGNTYLICAGGWRTGGSAPTINIVYSNASNVHQIHSWNAGGGIPSTGDATTYYHSNKCQIVYIKADVTLQLNISNNFGNVSRKVEKFL